MEVGAPPTARPTPTCQAADAIYRATYRHRPSPSGWLGTPWQLDGHRVPGAAPTGISTVCLDFEGFEHARTVDRLLAELDQSATLAAGAASDEPLLDARTVLVVDEAGMVGSRKLARLRLRPPDRRQDDPRGRGPPAGRHRRAGGGFSGLRLRLGALELTENRRQQQIWEREAVEHLRNGDLDQALGAYRSHGRLVAAETPTQLKGSSCWATGSRLFQHGGPGRHPGPPPRGGGPVQHCLPASSETTPATSAAGASRSVTAASGGRRSGGLLYKNALRSLGVALVAAAKVLALDPEERSLTLRLDNGQEVTLVGRYLDHRPA